MLRKIAQISIWLTILIIWIFSSAFVNKSYQKILLSDIEINFISNNQHNFITKQEVKDILSSLGLVKGVASRGNFDIKLIENKIFNHPAVKKVDVFFVNNGKLVINIEKRTPIGRVISTAAEKNFYIDKDGFLMPLCSTYVAKVPLFSGEIRIPETINIFSLTVLNELQIIRNIYKMSQLINNDSFLKSQIVQIHINNNGYFELIPRIGNQRILFGMPKNMEKKFNKLKCFYTNGPSSKELNLYDTLNVMYNDQIICSKRI